jgi:hypothetical protein
MLQSCTYDRPYAATEKGKSPVPQTKSRLHNGPRWFKWPTGPNIYVTNSAKYINHGLINYIDTKAKCPLKKLTFEGRRLSKIIGWSGNWKYS